MDLYKVYRTASHHQTENDEMQNSEIAYTFLHLFIYEKMDECAKTLIFQRMLHNGEYIVVIILVAINL